MPNIVSNLGNSRYFLKKEQISKIAFNGEHEEEKSVEKPKKTEKRRDIYAEMPIRALGYSNELGEAIRPLSPLLANLSWLPAIGYIGADIADKYNMDEYGNEDPSKARASKQFVTQLLASVFLPTAAVKVGQTVANNAAKHSKVGLSLDHREKISDMILNSMNEGEHKAFTNTKGKIDKALYKESLAGKVDEVVRHTKTRKKLLKPFYSFVDFIKKPFSKPPKTEAVKEYAGTVVDRLIDTRQQLLDGIKPKAMSKKAFEKFMKLSKDVPLLEKQSMAFDAIRKLEKSKMFNNRILKSIGGLAALSIMAKPIDKFVEHVIIGKFVGPAIDNVKAKKDEKENA